LVAFLTYLALPLGLVKSIGKRKGLRRVNPRVAAHTGRTDGSGPGNSPIRFRSHAA